MELYLILRLLSHVTSKDYLDFSGLRKCDIVILFYKYSLHLLNRAILMTL